MEKNHDKAMLDLQRLLKTQDFKSIEEMQEFVNKNIVGQTIPSFDKTALSTEEQAQDLVYQAMEADDIFEADSLIYSALALDPDCAEAYEYLGDVAGSPLISLILFRNGVAAARKKLGDKFFRKNKGYFWGLHETRPFMRCLKNYADCLYMLGQKKEALDMYFELLELNPHDNQGNRDLAGMYCIELEQWDAFKKLHEQYREDACAFHYFNWALFLFVQEGDSEGARKALAEAKSHNKHVLKLMTAKKELPPMPDHYGFGDKNEAIMYCKFAKEIWQNKKGAMEWLAKSYFNA